MAGAALDVRIRALAARDLAQADHVMRLAFGTHLNLSDPTEFLGDADYVRSRYQADPCAAFAAEAEGQVVGSIFATNWGSVGFLGPLTIHPQWWNCGIAQMLMEPVVERFAAWDVRLAGLYTFANSARHIGLYQKFGFWPRFLQPVMSRKTSQREVHDVQEYSTLEPAARASALQACFELTSTVFAGLDVQREIRAVQEQNLGDTVITWDQGEVVSFAVCHCGPGSEAGSGRCYIKFGVVRSGPKAEALLEELISACDAFAVKHNASRLVAGVSTGRSRAYRALLGLGFRTDQIGISMHRPDAAGYDREDVFILDDWR